MKKFLLMLALIVPMIAFTSCGGDNDDPQPQKTDVEVNLDYTFVESGNMSRSGETSYQQFFENYIKTKRLAPKGYSLSFNNEDGIEVQTVSGPWGGASIKLREGTYQVSGTSFPTTYSKETGYYKYTSDSLYLNFSESVNISKTTKQITLLAKYDCYLLLFNADNIEQIQSTFAVAPQKAGNVYYLFVNAGTYSYMGNQEVLSIIITRKDGTRIRTKIGGLGFEKGKYYFFDDITNSFNIEPMPNGNQ